MNGHEAATHRVQRDERPRGSQRSDRLATAELSIATKLVAPEGPQPTVWNKTPSQERLSSNGKNTHITFEGAPRAQGWVGGLS